ncbi:MAG: DUF3307 domain-containing protein [Candidatus Paceibacteria bacterium]
MFIHWVADFVLQTNWEATNKSKNNIALLSHTLKYTNIWLAVGVIYVLCNLHIYTSWHLSYFLLITFVCHTVTDYFTSRLNSRLWKQKEVHKFFVSIGFDQFLHYVQLFLTYYLLKS